VAWWIIALFLFSHSASPRLDKTGYGTLGVAATVASTGTLLIFFHTHSQSIGSCYALLLVVMSYIVDLENKYTWM